jgi:prephenate dehydratase
VGEVESGLNSRLSVGVIGGPASFSGKSAERLRARHSLLGEPVYFQSGPAMIAALLEGRVDSMVGAHASAAGYTPLFQTIAAPNARVYVIAEEILPFECNLLGQADAVLDHISVVWGGNASLPLVRQFVARHLPRAELAAYTESAAAIEAVRAGDGSEVIIGTEELAAREGLSVLARNVAGDHADGSWWIVSTRPAFAAAPSTVFVSLRARDDGVLGTLVARLSEEGYRLSTVAAHPTGGQLLTFDVLARFRGEGTLAGVRAVLDTIAGCRLAGAITDKIQQNVGEVE